MSRKSDLAKSLSELAREIERADLAPKPAPLTVTSVPHRDEEHRLLYTDVLRSDGKRFRTTVRRDDEHRIIEKITEEIQ